MKTYKISQVSKLLSLTPRTIRYYEERGLLSSSRTDGGQRIYSDKDIVYLKRVIELKNLGFSLEEIEKIITLKKEDESGEKRRCELLKEYRKKYTEDSEKIEKLEEHRKELEWHVKQLESAEDGFSSCPGSLCASCEYKKKCIFFEF